MCHTQVYHKWLRRLDACAGSVLAPHDYNTNAKRLGNRLWVGGTAEASRGNYACVHAAVYGMKLADPGISSEPRGLTASQRMPADILPLLLSPDAARPWMCAWPPPLLQQLAETQQRRHLIANSRTTEMKLWNCGNRAAATRTQQTLPPVGTGSRCRRNHFSAGGNTKSKSLFYGGEQTWHEQFFQTHWHGQSGFSLVSLMEKSPLGTCPRS